MSYTLYDASVATAKDALSALSAVLTKAESHAAASALPAARLYEDMLPLSFQIFMTTDVAQKLAARGLGVDPLDLSRDLDNIADMQARITQVQEVLAKVDRDAFDARVDSEVTVGMGKGKEATMKLKEYVNGYAIPNLFFHTTTAYGILRKEGVPLGKMDYLTPFIGRYMSQ